MPALTIPKPIPAAPHEVCGACEHFEPAHYEPPINPKYGYCKPHLALMRERSLYPAARLVDVATLCFMLSANYMSGRCAFAPKKGSP